MPPLQLDDNWMTTLGPNTRKSGPSISGKKLSAIKLYHKQLGRKLKNSVNVNSGLVRMSRVIYSGGEERISQFIFLYSARYATPTK